MGRTLRRVPMDFDWPMEKLWEGYINPYRDPCPAQAVRTCVGGYSSTYEWLHSVVRMLLLLGDDARFEDAPKSPSRMFPHPYLMSILATACVSETPRMTKELTRVSTFLAGRKPSIMGHDGLDGYSATLKIGKLAGLKKGWHVCSVCKGTGIDPAIQAQHDAWKPTDPPTGDGFQLWCTTSTGAPLSPVFASLEELCGWCENNATTFARHRATAAEWQKMLAENFVHYSEGEGAFTFTFC